MMFVAVLACVACGCVDAPGVTRQKVPKQPTIEVGSTVAEADPDTAAAGPSEPVLGRMLAAIVPLGQKGWFFKIMGSSEAVANQQDNFNGLLRSVTVDGDRLAWKVPEGWSEQLGAGMRAATFRMGVGDTKLECSVIPLPAEDPTSVEYLLANINRWRGQLGLDPQSTDDFTAALKTSDDIQQFELPNGLKVTSVSIEGTISSGKSGPMMGRAGRKLAGPGLPPGHPPTTVLKLRTAPSGAKAVSSIPEMTFDVPGTWTPEPSSSSLRKISWALSADDSSAEMYISTLSAGGSDVAPNVTRWRRQVKLEALSGDALLETVETVTIGGLEGHLAEMIGEEKAILAAIVVRGGTGWFFTLKAPAEIAKAESGNFRKFLESVKFQ
jgi:hypothetical protein